WRAPLDPLDGAGKRQQRPLTGFQQASQENQRAAGAGDFARPLDQFAFLRGVEEFVAERYRHRGPIEYVRGDRKQAVIGEGHEGAAVDVAAGAVEVLVLDPERAADAAV